MPQPYHLQQLCELYQASAQELGFRATGQEPHLGHLDEQEDNLTAFRASYLPSRLLYLIGKSQYQQYHELQRTLRRELEDTPMDKMNRRDTLRFLAALPLDFSGLTKLEPAFRVSNEEVLVQCAAGIIACWQLWRSSDPTSAADAVAAYIPTLQAIANQAPTAQRKVATDLLAQCLHIQAESIFQVNGNFASAIATAQTVERLAEGAGNFSLQAESVILLGSIHYIGHQHQAARTAYEKALFLLEHMQTSHRFIQASDAYGHLARLYAQSGQKQQALRTIGKAQTMFFASPQDEQQPIWVTQNLGGLVECEALTHAYLGEYTQALETWEQHKTIPGQSVLGAVQVTIRKAGIEVSRDDQPRDMDYAITCWTKGIQGAQELGSQQRMKEAYHVYEMMQVAWPHETRIKDLRDLLLN
jgi:tetratricopeptide (TPR) repeat protein